jgi:hypothetical protein
MARFPLDEFNSTVQEIVTIHRPDAFVLEWQVLRKQFCSNQERPDGYLQRKSSSLHQ